MEYKDIIEEFKEKEWKYKVSMLGLVNPDKENIGKFLSAEREYEKGLRKLIAHLKQEIHAAKSLKDSVTGGNKDDKD